MTCHWTNPPTFGIIGMKRLIYIGISGTKAQESCNFISCTLLEVVLFCSVWKSYFFALYGCRTVLLSVEVVLFCCLWKWCFSPPSCTFFLPSSTFFLLSVVRSSYHSQSYLMATFPPCRTFYSLFTCRMPFRLILVERNSLKINTFYVKLSSLVFL